MKIAGVDEAGRGPVIGPLVICGALFDSKNIIKLDMLGVKDSKMLSPEKRKKLYPAIRKLADKISICRISPLSIDKANINTIERNKTVCILKKLNPDIAILDLPLRKNTSASDFYEKRIEESLVRDHKKIYIKSWNKADKNYLAVAAASIIAKVTRDRFIENLHSIYGDFGSGYTSDPKTRKWIKDNLMINCSIIRYKWKTVSMIRNRKL